MCTAAAYAVPVQVGSFSFGGETFQAWSVGAGGTTWTDANSFANSNGETLAILDTASENTAVFNWLSTNHPTLWNNIGVGPWIGGIQATSADPFRWVDGSTVTNAIWGPSQPDGNEGYPNALLFYPQDGRWGDYGAQCGAGSCGAGNVLGFVTEDVPEPGTLALFGTALLGFGWFRRREAKA